MTPSKIYIFILGKWICSWCLAAFYEEHSWAFQDLQHLIAGKGIITVWNHICISFSKKKQCFSLSYLTVIWDSKQHGQMCNQPDQREWSERHVFGIQGIWIVSSLRFSKDMARFCTIPERRRIIMSQNSTET